MRLLRLLVVVLLMTPAAPARAAVIGPEEFLARVAAARSAAREGFLQPSPEAMEGVRAALGLPVELGAGGSSMMLAKDVVLEGLDGDTPSDFQTALAHLDVLQNEVRRLSAPGQARETDIQRSLRSAYAGLLPSANPFQRFADRVALFLEEHLADFMNFIARFGRQTSLVAWLILVGLVALATWFVVSRLKLSRDVSSAGGKASKGRVVDWQAEAESAFAAGDLERAVRAQYQVLVQALASRGAVKTRPSLTSGDCRVGTARNLPSAYGVVDLASSAFERVSYGRDAPDAGDLDAVRVATEAVRAS
jgi:hypothetical protein